MLHTSSQQFKTNQNENCVLRETAAVKIQMLLWTDIFDLQLWNLKHQDCIYYLSTLLISLIQKKCSKFSLE